MFIYECMYFTLKTMASFLPNCRPNIEFDFENGEWKFDRADQEYIFHGPVTIAITCMLRPEQDPLY